MNTIHISYKSRIAAIKNTPRNLALIVALVCSALSASSQFEPMFSQYMFNELIINPGYAGSRDAMSIVALHRDQWVGLDGAPKTQTLSLHTPIAHNKMGVGFSIINERIGVTRQTGFYGNGAYRIAMKKATLSLGLQLGFLSHQERLSEVHTDVAGDNQFIINSDRVMLPNFGFGAHYQREKFYAGISIPRLMENRVNVSLGETNVHNRININAWHYFVTIGGVKDLNGALKIRPTIMLKNVVGAPIEMDLSASLIFHDLIWAGLGYRTGDAASVMVGANITPQLRFGYAYDYTLSELQKFNSGSHEIMLGYDLRFIKDRITTPRYF
jgi:type IX secretion system PorP/SprF family membrane protein